MRGIDLNLLIAFEALFAECNVTLAARRLGVTQPAMSNSLRRLRALLGDPLFVRTSVGMVPTPRALALGPAISAALNSIRDSIRTTGFDRQRSAARFSVATLDYLEAIYFPKLIGKLVVVAPRVRLEIHRLAAIYELPLQQLQSGAMDCALGLFPQPLPPGSSLRGQIVGQEEWVCIARRGHPTFRRGLSLKAYADLKHLVVRYPEVSGGGGMIDDLLATHGLARSCPVAVPHFTTLAFHVAQSDCVAPMPRRLASLFVRALPLQMTRLPLEESGNNISLIWHSRVENDPAHRWLRQMIIDAVR